MHRKIFSISEVSELIKGIMDNPRSLPTYGLGVKLLISSVTIQDISIFHSKTSKVLSVR